MTAIRVWVRAVLRQRWRATVVLALLIGIAGAAAIGAADGARRTQTAFPRMRAATNGADLLVSVGGTGLSGYYDALGRLPEVESYGVIAGIPLAVFDKSGKPNPTIGPIPNAAVDDRALFRVQRAKIVAGRNFDPNAVDEAVIDPKTAASLHLHVGSALPMFLATKEDGSTGTRLTFRIVGIGVTQDGVVATTPLGTQPSITLTPAFFNSQPTLRIALQPGHRRDAVLNYDGAFVRLRPGTDIPAFEEKASELSKSYPDTFGTFIENLTQTAERVQHAIIPLAIALYAFAGLVAVALLFVLGQAIARQQFVEADEYSTLRALGFTRTQVFGVSLTRVAVVVLLGSLLAVAGSLAVSPFMPIGPARIAETHLGFEVNVAILGMGAGALIVLLMVRAIAPAARVAFAGSRAAGPARTSVLADAAARAGLAPSVTAGVRMAFEQRRGSRSLPLRSALAGSIVGLAALTAALMFGTSLNRLVTVPTEYGQRWDLVADSSFGILPLRANEAALRADPDISGYTAGNYGSLVIGQRDVPTIGLDVMKGDAYPALLGDGRRAESPDEIVLGTTVMRRLKTSIGGTISVTFPLQPKPRLMRVVGRAVFPSLGRGTFAPTSLGDGAAVIADDFAYLEKIFNDGATESNNFLLIKLRAGANQAPVKQRLHDLFVAPECEATNDCSIFSTQRPIELGVLTRVRSVPLILAGLLALFAAATLAHALLTSVRLRSHDLAILKTIGFVRRQIRATVAWQTSVLAFTALLFGLPLGVIGGRAIWSIFANDLGVPADAVISFVVVIIAIPATLLLANVIGAAPARAAARTEAAVVLRTE